MGRPPKAQGSGQVTVGIDGFSAVLMEIAEDCVSANDEALRRNVQLAGNATANELRNGALTPAVSGEYAAGWSKTTEKDGIGFVKVVIHNKKKPGLTHLLEKGHEKWIHGVDTGERVPAYPHIESAYEVGADRLRRG